MGIQRLQKNDNIFPKLLNRSGFQNYSLLPAGSYTTLLNINGKGIISRMSFCMTSSTPLSYLYIKITIDGYTFIVQGSGTTFLNSVRDASYTLDFTTPLSFNSNIIIQAMQQYGSGVTIDSVIEYGLY
ncbi:hypothetical protein [Anoxybacillus ayderensis]|uniref:hypothetical protein n=1 Tax=Anoxybacillus ayderensis TaxID=265546 RepID=UPI002E1C7066|nr:hypothetical protein [Anoxybacillus ayderensis]